MDFFGQEICGGETKEGPRLTPSEVFLKLMGRKISVNICSAYD